MKRTAARAWWVLLLGWVAGCSSGPALELEERDSRTFLLVREAGREIELLREEGVGPLRLESKPGGGAAGQDWFLRWDEQSIRVDPFRVHVNFWGAHSAAVVIPETDALLICADGRPVMADAEAWRRDPGGYLRRERWVGTWQGQALVLELERAGEWEIGQRLLLDGVDLSRRPPNVVVGGASRVGPGPRDERRTWETDGFRLQVELKGRVGQGTFRLLPAGEEGELRLQLEE